ncbi:hypothetical protein GFY24_38210 [Nocardia sp. SYP-A9097]|nr:hypothetical protein [Nocardia sp. SYP-A9097]
MEVSVAGMRSTATGLEDAAARLESIRTALDSAAAAYNGCWGDDEYGHNFAKGDNGYELRKPALENVLTNTADRLRKYSGGLSDGATSFEIAEANNTDSFRS